MMRFYFLFDDESSGRVAQRILEQSGYGHAGFHFLEELNPPIWSLVVQREISSDEFFTNEDEIESMLSSIAADCGGEYDGHEFEVNPA